MALSLTSSGLIHFQDCLLFCSGAMCSLDLGVGCWLLSSILKRQCKTSQVIFGLSIELAVVQCLALLGQKVLFHSLLERLAIQMQRSPPPCKRRLLVTWQALMRVIYPLLVVKDMCVSRSTTDSRWLAARHCARPHHLTAQMHEYEPRNRQHQPL